MRFLLHRRLHVNMGAYEHTEDSATVEVDTIADADALRAQGVSPNDPASVQDFLSHWLDQLLAPGAQEAAYETSVEDSFIHTYSEALQKRIQ